MREGTVETKSGFIRNYKGIKEPVKHTGLYKTSEIKCPVNIRTYWVSLKAEVARPNFCSEVDLTVKEGSK